MDECLQNSLKLIEALNDYLDGWTNSEHDSDRVEKLLIEFDLTINQLCNLALKENDNELVLIYSQIQTILETLQESKPSLEQLELICAWPLYIAEFLSDRNDKEIQNTLAAFLEQINLLNPHHNPENTNHEATTDDHISDNVIQTPEKPLTDIDQEKYNYEEKQLSSEQQEFLDLINAEVSEIQESHDARLAVLSSENQDNEVLKEIIETQIDQLERIGSAAEMIGLMGLKCFTKQLEKIFAYIHSTDIKQIIPLHDEISQWPDIIQGHLFALNDAEYIQACLSYLSLDSWPIKLYNKELEIIKEAFNKSHIEADSKHQAERIHQATVENTSLVIPADVQEELVASLLLDLPEQTEEFSLAVQNLTNDDYINQLEIAKRIAHTLKGAGNTVGIVGLANLTHNLEDILEALLKAQQKPSQALYNALVEAADCLEEISEFLHGIGSAPKESIEIFQKILNWANYIDKNGVTFENENISEVDKKETLTESATNTQLLDSTNQKCKENIAKQSLRIPAHLIDELLKHAGENIISNSQIQESISRSKEFARSLRINNNKIKTLIHELEHIIEIRGFSAHHDRRSTNGKFDPLEMDQYNELHTFTNQLIEATEDSSEFLNDVEGYLTRLDKISSSQARTLMENQDAVLRTRMVPVKSIESRLKRSVRQACKLSNKSANLEILGEETLIDSDILNKLVDPLMHILRNAVDHGIETKEIRLEKNKAATGNIRLQFKKEGKLFYVICKDDGSGLDIDRIKSKALEQGIINEADDIDETKLINIILQHGFSTKDEVSQLSGRGVGLDIVFASIRDMKGTVNLSSITGQGVNIGLTIPTTYHSAHALLVSSANNTLAISDRGIEEILYPGAGNTIAIDEYLYFQFKNDKYPVINLQSILFEKQNSELQNNKQTTLIVQDDFKNKFAVIVDRVLDTREIVVKPFSRYIPKISGLLGTTVLGDGSITTVVDLTEIIRMSSKSTSKTATTDHININDIVQKNVLIVEDAISTRKSLSLFMHDLGFNVETAIDGVDAIDKIQKQMPSLVLTDLEMPRMNGLELTKHLRSNAETADVPIVMITSRSTNKHQKEAQRIGVSEYLTKPYDEDKLLNVVNSLGIAV